MVSTYRGQAELETSDSEITQMSNVQHISPFPPSFSDLLFTSHQQFNPSDMPFITFLDNQGTSGANFFSGALGRAIFSLCASSHHHPTLAFGNQITAPLKEGMSQRRQMLKSITKHIFNLHFFKKAGELRDKEA